MSKALIVVDVQNDFCEGGPLAVSGADEILAPINELIMSDVFDVVVLTQDWHPANHSSFKENNGPWPRHCVQGTSGADFKSGLAIYPYDDLVTPWPKIIQKGMDPAIDSYSGFYDNDGKNPTGLTEYLKDMEIDEVYCVGLALNFCVKATALDAVKEGFKTFVYLPGCRGISTWLGEISHTIATMEQAGVKVVEKIPEIEDKYA